MPDSTETVKLGEPVPLSGQPTSWTTDQIPSVYANVIGMAITPFDFALTFGELQSATAESVIAKPSIKVTIPPEVAKIMCHVITLGLKQYVEGNGPLRPTANIPPTSANEVEKDQFDAPLQKML